MPTPALRLPIHTPRLVLRDFGPDDLAGVRSYAADGQVLEHVLHEPRDEPQLREHLERVLAAQGNRPRRAWELAVVVARTGRVIGACDLAMTGRTEADIGYLLARRHWGHGYATELGTALIEAAFVQLRVRRVQAIVDVRNERSRRVLEKCGLRWTGLLRRHAHAKGRWWDCHLYSLERADWLVTRELPAAVG